MAIVFVHDIIHLVAHNGESPSGGLVIYRLKRMFHGIKERCSQDFKRYIMTPHGPYELHGNCDHAIFACDAIAEYKVK